MKKHNISSAETNSERKQGGGSIIFFAFAHLLCCGIPLLILSGVSITAFFSSRPALAIGLALLGVIGFIWYLKRGCATCPRNEGRCIGGNCETSLGKYKVEKEEER
jgi:hypothetical protein